MPKQARAPKRRPAVPGAKKRAAAEAAAAATEARAGQLKRALMLVVKLEQALEQCYKHQVHPLSRPLLLSSPNSLASEVVSTWSDWCMICALVACEVPDTRNVQPQQQHNQQMHPLGD